MENLGGGGKKKSLPKSVRAESVCFLYFLPFHELEIEFEDAEGARLFEIKAASPCFQIVCLLKKP